MFTETLVEASLGGPGFNSMPPENRSSQNETAGEHLYTILHNICGNDALSINGMRPARKTGHIAAESTHQRVCKFVSALYRSTARMCGSRREISAL